MNVEEKIEIEVKSDLGSSISETSNGSIHYEQPFNNSNDDKNKLKSDDTIFCVPLPVQPIPVSSINKASSAANTSTKIQSTTHVPPLRYDKPEWSSLPPEPIGESILDQEGYCDHYYLEVIKNGVTVDNIKLSKEFISFGRLEVCDIPAEHPTLSRYHAIFQYSNGLKDNNFQQGFYIYDLGSTHGTMINKKRIEANKYVLINLESIIKFGQSTRLYILHGPKSKYSSDDLKINLTHDQMKKIKEKHSQLSMKLRIRKELEEEEELERLKSENKSINWGFNEGEVSDDKGDNTKNNENQIVFGESIGETDESFYSDDPRKALKNFFDREGRELVYDVEELGNGKFKCQISLPIENNYGESIYAEATHEGKKKDCMTMCALEACRILNSEGVLKQSRKESARKKREKDWESGDYYDSDDDEYLDRTGDIEKKRIQRMLQAGKILDEKKMLTMQKNVAITFDMILHDLKLILSEQHEIESKLDKCKQVFKAISDDDVDAYIKSLQVNQSSVDTVTRAKMKRRLVEIKNELVRLDRLLKAAKPIDFDVQKWKDELNKNLKQSSELAENAETKKPSESSIASVSTEIKETKVQHEASSEEIFKSKTKDLEKVDQIISNDENKKQKQKEPKINLENDDSVVQSQDLTAPVAKRNKKSEYTPTEIMTSYEKLNPQDYATWLPPEGQTGDGKTNLNAKYGY